QNISSSSNARYSARPCLGGHRDGQTHLFPRRTHRRSRLRQAAGGSGLSPAWQQALKDRGHDVIDASVRLLKRGPYPTAEQQKFLLNAGDGESLWNGLTITGIVEARGAMLATVSAPDFQNIVVEDLSETCLGHLNKGLLEAHGWD